MLWAVITPERREKSSRILNCLALGWPNGRLIDRYPPDDHSPFAVWGQIWTALQLINKYRKVNRPFWQVDNGYWRPPGPYELDPHYRLSYRSMSALYLPDAPAERAKATGVKFSPWRKDGRHILLALPSVHYGKAMGIDTAPWIFAIEKRIRAVTDRPIIVRQKPGPGMPAAVSVEQHFKDCWAVVTHSSNICLDAVRAGIPCFVEPTAPTAPLGNLDLTKIEAPEFGDRDALWRSLLCQNFSLSEMQSGLAYSYLKHVAEIVDRKAHDNDLRSNMANG